MNGGATQAATSGQTLVSNVTGNRTSSLRGASSGDVLQNTGLWAQALYSDANQDLRDGVAGFNAYSRGIAIGADGKLTDQLTLGVAYSFLHTSVNSDSGNTTDVDGNALTLYSGFEQGNYFVDANLSYGLNDNESKRRIASTTAKGDYDSQVLGANVVGGYTYHLNEQFWSSRAWPPATPASISMATTRKARRQRSRWIANATKWRNSVLVCG